MKQHFVTFYSPGTFVAESTTKPIDAWDVDKARDMARSITERYNATPFGFRFSTRERGENDLDSHQSAESVMYYLGGTIYTVEEIRARALPDERILLSNMESGDIQRVIVNTNSWKYTSPIGNDDVVLKWDK